MRPARAESRLNAVTRNPRLAVAGAVFVIVVVVVVVVMTVAPGRGSKPEKVATPAPRPASPAQVVHRLQQTLQANAPRHLYELIAGSSLRGRSQTQFVAGMQRQIQRTGPVTVARVLGRPKVSRTAVGPVMTVRLRLRYARAAGGDYIAVFVPEGRSWKLAYTRPLRLSQ
jgi:hypothetical protein